MTTRSVRQVLLAFMLGAGCAVSPTQQWPPQQQPAGRDDAMLARGAYLSKIGGCANCHTMPGHGIPFAGGRPVPSPLGPIISSNITPDPVRGIGRYNFEDFERVMREGTAPGPKHLYPAMPYTAYAKADDKDLRALYHYLMHGVQPSDLAPPPTRLSFPFDQRWALALWKAIFVPRAPYAPRPARTAEWNRGAYLVQSFGHCGACHTPRGVAYQERGTDESSSRFLTGMVTDDWFAANLTGDPGAGLGRFDAATIARYLRTGHAEGLAAAGSMAEEIEQSLQYLSEPDASAIATYLKSLPAQRLEGSWRPAGPAERTAAQGNYTGDVPSTGANVYRAFCSRCHQPDGQGVRETFPRLAGNPSVLSKDTTTLVRIVLQGGRAPATATGPAPQAMPGFADTLSDVQIAQVLGYVRQAWGNDARPVTAGDVAKLRKPLAR